MSRRRVVRTPKLETDSSGTKVSWYSARGERMPWLAPRMTPAASRWALKAEMARIPSFLGLEWTGG